MLSSDTYFFRHWCQRRDRVGTLVVAPTLLEVTHGRRQQCLLLWCHRKTVLSGSGLKGGRKTSTSLPFQGKPRPISIFSILNSVCFAPRASFATFPNTPLKKEKKGPKPQQEKLKWTRLSAAVLSFFRLLIWFRIIFFARVFPLE